jgi:hypothetical protein
MTNEDPHPRGLGGSGRRSDVLRVLRDGTGPMGIAQIAQRLGT